MRLPTTGARLVSICGLMGKLNIRLLGLHLIGDAETIDDLDETSRVR
jgi:hypothetical protein